MGSLLKLLPDVAESLTNNDQHFYSGLVRDAIKEIEAHRARNVGGDVGEDAEPRHIRIYHEDFGFVLWWTRPVTEPPYVGSPLCDDWPGYHQWWTPLPPIPNKLKQKQERGAECGLNQADADNLEAQQALT